MTEPSCSCDGWCAGRRYTCPGCHRFVPFCFGAADPLYPFCDDCWATCDSVARLLFEMADRGLVRRVRRGIVSRRHGGTP